MLLTITSTTPPARDLGYVLRKHPDRAQEFTLSFGVAHVWYPEASDERTTAALLVDIDPVALVARRRRGALLTDYVNDRPYVASSFMSVALGQVLGSALRGSGDDADPPRSLKATVAVVASADGPDALHDLFAPLGYRVTATTHALAPGMPEWGDSPYVTLTLTGERSVGALLRHLYVLLPVLDGAKHYWIDDSEVDKLLRAGAGWLADHPQRDLITRRYLKGQRSMTSAALDRLVGEVEGAAPDGDVPSSTGRTPLHALRRQAVAAELLAKGANRVLDLGCGEGRLIADLLREPTIAHITGVDVSMAALRRAAQHLRLDELSHHQRERVTLLQSALTYRDARLRGYDAAAVVEVIEHLDPWRLDAFADVVFGDAHPATVVVTTPNADHNVAYPDLAHGGHRHADHRFEWGRDRFAAWADGVAATHGYEVAVRPVGEVHPEVGAPTQLAVFTATVAVAP